MDDDGIMAGPSNVALAAQEVANHHQAEIEANVSGDEMLDVEDPDNQEEDNSLGLADLTPTDLYHIFQYLPWRSKKNMRLACKYFFEMITHHDKRFSVLKVDLSDNRFIDLDFLRASSLDICVKIPTDKDLDKQRERYRDLEDDGLRWMMDEMMKEGMSNDEVLASVPARKRIALGRRNARVRRALGRHGSELDMETNAIDFISEFQHRIVGIEAGCTAVRVLEKVAPKLTRLQKIKLHYLGYSIKFKLLLDLIKKNAATLEQLNILRAKFDVDEIGVDLPNLKVLHLEEVSGEKIIASILTNKCTPKLRDLKLWNLHLNVPLPNPPDNVKILSFSNCRGVPAINSLITQSAASLQDLELNFVDFNVTNEIVAMPNMRELSIMTCTGNNYLSTLLTKCAPSLTRLTIWTIDMCILVFEPMKNLREVKINTVDRDIRNSLLLTQPGPLLFLLINSQT